MGDEKNENKNLEHFWVHHNKLNIVDKFSWSAKKTKIKYNEQKKDRNITNRNLWNYGMSEMHFKVTGYNYTMNYS